MAYLLQDGQGIELTGTSIGIQDDTAWTVDYAIELDHRWVTRRATIRARAGSMHRTVVLKSTGPGVWQVDGRRAPELDGCPDVDLDVSALTNSVPLRRLRTEAMRGGSADIDDSTIRVGAAAVYVRASDLAVTRLEQTYQRTRDGQGLVYEYQAPAAGFSCQISYDAAGLVRDYPGIAVRVH